jgi:hypothetical protein
MTATVHPGEYAEQIRRNSTDLRTRDYLQAIKFWVEHPDSRIKGVVFCENSGADLGVFQRRAKDVFSRRPFEALGFFGNCRPPNVHYGYAELGTIDYACRNSRLLNEYPHFAKATGRYIFPKISALVDSLEDELRVAVDCRRAYHSEAGVCLRLRTQLMFFQRTFYQRVLQGKREQMLGNCSHIEEFIAQKLFPLYRDGTPGVYLRWKVECPTFGHGAASDKPYASSFETVKNTTRAFCRWMMPMLWL